MDGRTADGQTDGHTDKQHDTIIPCHYRMAGYKNNNVWRWLGKGFFSLFISLFIK